MTISLKHTFQSAKADGVDTTLVQPSNWNAEHTITCATDKVLGRATAGTGAVEEITCTSLARTIMTRTTGSAICTDISALPLTGGTLTGNLSIINSTTEMRLTLGSSGGYYFGNATLAGFKNSGGTARVSWNISTGDFTAAGNVTAYSDARLKTDVETINNALALVGQMRGVRYVRRSDGAPGVGVIAQEMQKVVPEVVIGNDSGYLSVAYPNLVGVLIEAVKELSARVEALEGK